jgi:carboxyl-terminal processing protease
MLYIPDLKKVKDMLKKVYLFLVLGAALACKAAPAKPIKVVGSNDLQPDVRQELAAKTAAELILKYDYKKVELNDSISEIIFNNYIKALDEDHSFLMAADIKDFDKYKDVLDDDIKAGNLNDAFYIFNVYQKRYLDDIKFSLAHVDDNFNFSKNENFIVDREDLPWLANQNEANDQWTKRVKFDLLNLKLANPDMAKDRATLKKRYQDLLSQSNKYSNQEVFQIFMTAFTSAIDPHAYFFNPFEASQFSMENSRSLEGIGATLGSDNDYITIETLVHGGPADKSKMLNVKDRIVAVAEGKDGEFTNIVGWNINSAIGLIRGPKGSIVRLQILPAGAAISGKPKTIELVRDKIVLQDDLAKKEIRTYNNNGKTVTIGIINVPEFYIDLDAAQAGATNYHSITRDVKLIVDSLKEEHVDGIVLDLRGDPGGNLGEAISLTGLFIKQGPVVQVRDTRDQVEVEKDDDPSIEYSGPLGVLVDRLSASASEIFAGALQDYGRAVIIGTKTYGKGTVQEPIPLDKVISPSLTDMINKAMGKSAPTGGSESEFGQQDITIQKFYRITGNSTQRHGVTPDIAFPSVIPLDKVGEDTDPSAMPFDIIAKSDYTKFSDLSPAIIQLKKMHDQRMSISKSYQYLLDDIANYKKHEEERSVTLNEAELKKQRDDDDQKLFDRSNEERAALGLPQLKKGEAKPKNEDLDFVKIEAGQIISDFVTINGRLTTVTNPAQQMQN